MPDYALTDFHYTNERERNFEKFVNDVLPGFWDKTEKLTIQNERGNTLAYLKAAHPSHDKAIFLVTGRVESYLRYKELIYDLYHAKYDVYCLDHLGQGLSDRVLEDEQRGHIEDFQHYVYDLVSFCEKIILPHNYKKRFALAHSMGGGVLAHSILLKPNLFNAIAFCAPMFGINIPLPEGVANTILSIAERYPSLRDYYALGTGKWRALPFIVNRLTHSKVRYEHNLALLEANPDLKMGGPTYHWVKECRAATKALRERAHEWQLPSIVLQAEDELLVCNASQRAFIEKCAYSPEFILVKNARHELLMETDEIRVFVIDNILKFFARFET